MGVIEKVLEEIEAYKKAAYENKNFGGLTAFKIVQDIIRKHMNDDWIPLEKKLPEKGQNALLCSDDGRMMIGVFQNDYYTAFGVAVAENYNQTMHNCVAWRPLPEPYRPERSEE